MTQQKKMYKVISPMEKRGGGTYWMRVGSAFTNRDDSINVYLEAMPAPSLKAQRFELQIRELTEEDLRRRESWNASNASATNPANRDLGGIGGGPTFESRAVTASGASNDVPF